MRNAKKIWQCHHFERSVHIRVFFSLDSRSSCESALRGEGLKIWVEEVSSGCALHVLIPAFIVSPCFELLGARERETLACELESRC